MSVSLCLPLMRKALLMTKPSSPLRPWVISISSVALKQQTTPTLFRCLAPRLFWPQLPRRARPLPLPEATNPFTHQPALGGVQVTAAPAATAWTPHPACIAKSLGSICGTSRNGAIRRPDAHAGQSKKSHVGRAHMDSDEQNEDISPQVGLGRSDKVQSGALNV